MQDLSSQGLPLETLRIGFVSDIHWPPSLPCIGGWHNRHDFEGVAQRLETALRRFAERDLSRVMIGGDLVHSGDPDSLRAVLQACACSRVPVRVVTGNHDVEPDPSRLGRAIVELDLRTVAMLSGAGEFEGRVRLLGLHVAETDGWFGARLQAPPDTAGWGDEPALVVSHFPLLSRAQLLSAHGFPYPGDLLDRRRALEPLSVRTGPTIVLSGHIHARDSAADGAVLQLTQGSLIEAPYECAVIDIRHTPTGELEVARESVRLAPGDVAREPVFVADREVWTFTRRRWRRHDPGATRLPPAGITDCRVLDQ